MTSLGDSETDYFKDVLLDFVRWDMTVSLQKPTACGAEIFYLLQYQETSLEY